MIKNRMVIGLLAAASLIMLTGCGSRGYIPVAISKERLTVAGFATDDNIDKAYDYFNSKYGDRRGYILSSDKTGFSLKRVIKVDGNEDTEELCSFYCGYSRNIQKIYFPLESLPGYDQDAIIKKLKKRKGLSDLMMLDVLNDYFEPTGIVLEEKGFEYGYRGQSYEITVLGGMKQIKVVPYAPPTPAQLQKWKEETEAKEKARLQALEDERLQKEENARKDAEYRKKIEEDERLLKEEYARKTAEREKEAEDQRVKLQKQAEERLRKKAEMREQSKNDNTSENVIVRRRGQRQPASDEDQLQDAKKTDQSAASGQERRVGARRIKTADTDNVNQAKEPLNEEMQNPENIGAQPDQGVRTWRGVRTNMVKSLKGIAVDIIEQQ